MGKSKRDVHLVGSVPLESADEVFGMTGKILGARLKRYPDGETGRRKNWINFQYAILAEHPAFEFAGAPVDPEQLVGEGGGRGSDYQFTPLRLKSNAQSLDLTFGALGYAENALQSYALFAARRAAGELPAEARFQVSLPTPLAPIALFVSPANMFAVYPHYLQALLREIDEILAAIPHRDLAIQFDVAVEFGLWEGLFPPPPGDWRKMLLSQLALLGNHVPADVELGYHLCYGDRGHKHFVEPADTKNLVEVANGIAAGLERSLEWIHMPVPRGRHDVDYFRPLSGLKLPESTRLFLGLVHLTDGVEGARRRIAAAEQVIAEFGVATECGMGRRDPATIERLLAIHAAVD